MFKPKTLFPRVAFTVCEWPRMAGGANGFDGLDGPEPPTDYALADFFAPNCPAPR
ncbi:MAG: hypothetical protein PHE27_03270 [Alphaproteobacteria bacterium]|nr:hypothetical protein [Alphaproteobacteria bacterium]